MPRFNTSERCTTSVPPPEPKEISQPTARRLPSALKTLHLDKSLRLSRNISRPSTPRERDMSVPVAELALDFIVVGAGMSGLAVGFALAQSGHRVHIFERNPTTHQRAAGVRVPPNVSKILYEWGLHEELQKASKCLNSTFLSLETNEPVGVLQWHGEVIKETGGDLLLMHYDDLYNLLYNLTLSKGVKITFGARIKSVQFNEEIERPEVELEDGTVHRADVIVGADGYTSVVRTAVTGEPDNAVDTGMSLYSIVVPAEKLQDDPDWSPWLAKEEWPIWMGTGRNILAYPIRSGKEICVHAYHPDNLAKPPSDSEDWSEVVPTSDIDHDDAHPSIHRIFKAVPNALHVKYMKREILEEWVDDSGTIVLIGEAAHALMPCTVHNLSLAIEDAAVLGALMGHLRERRQIAQFLEAFHDLRFSRVQQVHQSELYNAAFTCLPPGEDRDARNAALGQTLALANANNSSNSAESDNTELSDEVLGEQWEQISFVFGYNAMEDAEDWWYKWGAIGDSGREPAMTQPLFCQVVEVESHSVAC